MESLQKEKRRITEFRGVTGDKAIAVVTVTVDGEEVARVKIPVHRHEVEQVMKEYGLSKSEAVKAIVKKRFRGVINPSIPYWSDVEVTGESF